MNQYLKKIITAAEKKLPKKVGEITLIQSKLSGSVRVKYKEIFQNQKYPHKAIYNLIADLDKFGLRVTSPDYFQHDFHIEGIIYFGMTFIIPANDVTNMTLSKTLTILAKHLIHPRLIPEIFWNLEQDESLFVTVFFVPPVPDTKRESERKTGKKEKDSALALMRNATAPLIKVLGNVNSQSRHSTTWMLNKSKTIPPHDALVKILEKEGFSKTKKDTENETVFLKKIGQEDIYFSLHRNEEKEFVAIDFTNLNLTHQD